MVGYTWISSKILNEVDDSPLLIDNIYFFSNKTILCEESIFCCINKHYKFVLVHTMFAQLIFQFLYFVWEFTRKIKEYFEKTLKLKLNFQNLSLISSFSFVLSTRVTHPRSICRDNRHLIFSHLLFEAQFFFTKAKEMCIIIINSH